MRAFATRAGAALLLVGLVLAGGSTPEPAGAQPDEMVSVIVTLEDQATLAGITAPTRRGRLVRVIAALRNNADATQIALRGVLEGARRAGLVREYRSFWVFNGFEVTATKRFVAWLARRTEVRKITPNAALQAPVDDAEPSTPEANIALIGASDLWGLGYSGAGVVVASMDTGVDASHPDLSAQWRGGTNSWFDPNGQHPSTPIDLSGHGTRTMGAIVGRDAGGTAVGVAPDAQWIAVKIFNDSGSATVAGIHAGFQWLLDPDGNPATPDAPHVVNNSWTFSGTGCNLEFQLDLQALRAANIVPVFAAGNYGPSGSTSRSPANNPEAFAVGASTKTDLIWTPSARGPSACAEPDPIYPELVAPGASIRTTDRFGGWVTTSGTSLAAPHVAGAIALLLDAHPGTVASQLETALELSALDLGAAGPDNTFGHGRLDALAAHQWLGTAPPDFALAASPSSASTAQGGAVTFTMSVSPFSGFAADVSLAVSGLPDGASASFEPAVLTGGSGSSQLSVSTSASTPAGGYLLTVTGTAGALSHTASVTLVVETPPDFAIAVSPTSATVTAGGNAAYTISIAALNGFSSGVSLSLVGLPAGVGGSFAPQTVSGTGTSQLTVTTSTTTAPGSYALTVTGSAGSVVRSSPATLVVNAPPSEQTAFPASTTIVTGSLRGGSATDLAADDIGVFSVNAAFGGSLRVSSWYGTVTGMPNSLNGLKVTYKGRNSVTCGQTVSVWNWSANSWTQLDSRSVGNADVLIADRTPPGVAAGYVSGTTGPGDVRVRIRCAATSASFYASGNLLKLTYSP